MAITSGLQKADSLRGSEYSEAIYALKQNDGVIGRNGKDRSAVAKARNEDAIEDVICFTPGALISTKNGMVPVEKLRAGDTVITRDNGYQELAWIGRKELSHDQLCKASNVWPVKISAGSLGQGLPLSDMVVSPNHRLLILSAENRLFFDEAEVLIEAKHLVGRPGITQLITKSVSYIHLMCEHHELLLSDGFWTESFQPGPSSLAHVVDALGKSCCHKCDGMDLK